MNSPPKQQQLALIQRRVDGELIEQRSIDGYINVTAMCRAAGRLYNDYGRLAVTKAFLQELESVTGIPVTELVQSVRGGGPASQGTWAHPKVAINLGQWLSPKFAVQVSEWVYDWMTGRAAPRGGMPYHLRRYVRNRGNVPDGHFSMLTEMTQLIIAPMEEAGYVLPERMLPDISSGKIFSTILRQRFGVNTDAMPSYDHYYEDGRVIRARAYPDEFLPAFRHFMREEWIPQRAISYFRPRDPNSIEYLPTIYPKQIA